MEKYKVPGTDFDRIARTLRLCGHPVRLRLLCAIQRRQPCVSDLSACIEESQPIVSQHLAALKRGGIVSSRIEGNRRIYSVTDPFIKDMMKRLAGAGPRAGDR